MADLISPEYLAEQKRLHAAPQGYGGKGYKWASEVMLAAHKLQAETILDYGCGEGTLGKALRDRGFDCADYDPAVPAFAERPRPCDLVVATDVLEHIEPERLRSVLRDLHALSLKGLFVVVSLVPGNKVLSDGRSAHISLHDREWWKTELSRLFRIAETLHWKPAKQYVALYRP